MYVLTVLEIRQMRKVSDGQPCNNFRLSAIFLRCRPIEDLMKNNKYMDVLGQPRVWNEVIVRQLFWVSGRPDNHLFLNTVLIQCDSLIVSPLFCEKRWPQSGVVIFMICHIVKQVATHICLLFHFVSHRYSLSTMLLALSLRFKGHSVEYVLQMGIQPFRSSDFPTAFLMG